MNSTMKQKLGPALQEMIQNQTLPDPVSVISQVKGDSKETSRLNDEDRQMMETVGGKILDDLWLINAYSADIPAKALEMLVLSSRVTHIHHNSDVTGEE